VAGEQGERPRLEVAGSRASRILGGRAGEGGRSIAIAVVSTAVFFGLLALVVVTSPGWPEVREAFFNGEIFRDSFPSILDAFWLNVRIFLIAEGVILVTALVIAVLRSLPGPVFFPVRVVAVAYTDLFRGVPTILVI
jgi:polar amino acid transport system permease protein